jgi:hypothetical protein
MLLESICYKLQYSNPAEKQKLSYDDKYTLEYCRSILMSEKSEKISLAGIIYTRAKKYKQCLGIMKT